MAATATNRYSSPLVTTDGSVRQQFKVILYRPCPNLTSPQRRRAADVGERATLHVSGSELCIDCRAGWRLNLKRLSRVELFDLLVQGPTILLTFHKGEPDASVAASDPAASGTEQTLLLTVVSGYPPHVWMPRRERTRILYRTLLAHSPLAHSGNEAQVTEGDTASH